MSKRNIHAVGISSYLAGVELMTCRVKAGSAAEGSVLRDGLVRGKSGATILAIKRSEEVISNPEPAMELQTEDVVVLLGNARQLSVASTLFDSLA